MPSAADGCTASLHSYLPCTQCEQNGTRRYARRMCYPIAQCVDGEGFARRVAGKRGKVMGCKPSCGGKGQAFTPEQRPQRARGQWQQSPSREAVSLATRGTEWARRARHPPGQTRWYRGIQPSLGNVHARGRFFCYRTGPRIRNIGRRQPSRSADVRETKGKT